MTAPTTDHLPWQRRFVHTTRRMRLGSVAATALAVVAGLLFSAVPASAQVKAPGEYFEIDFTAAAPLSYNHLTGGGAYDAGRTNIDTVQSLEGKDFVCGDIVSFMTKIKMNDGVAAAYGATTVRLRYSWDMASTGSATGNLSRSIEHSEYMIDEKRSRSAANSDCWSRSAKAPWAELLQSLGFAIRCNHFYNGFRCCWSHRHPEHAMAGGDEGVVEAPEPTDHAQAVWCHGPHAGPRCRTYSGWIPAVDEAGRCVANGLHTTRIDVRTESAELHRACKSQCVAKW